MIKTSRILASALALLGIFTLAGCADVVVSGAVIDHENAVFVMDESFSYEGMQEYYDRSLAGDFSGASEGSVAPIATTDVLGLWSSSDGSPREVLVSEDSIELYDSSSSPGELLWRGDFAMPSSGSTSFVWESTVDPLIENTIPNAEPRISFFFSKGVLRYNDGTTDVFLTRAQPASDDSSSDSTDSSRSDELTADELCDFVLKDIKAAFHVQGEENTYECGVDGLHLTTSYAVTYDYTGVTSVGGVELTPAERRNLPFSVAVDSVYGDVVFQHNLLGLSSQRYFSSPQQWLEAFTGYSVEFTFPGAVTEFSNDAIQNTPQSVLWDYSLVSAAVSSGDYTLSAAGRADPQVNPIPILLTVAGVLFLLVLVVYFMWKRVPPKAIIVTSYLLALVNPFGLALAIVAHKKARNNAEGLAQATIAIWINSAIWIFQLLVIALLIILAPESVLDLLTSIGLASSSS